LRPLSKSIWLLILALAFALSCAHRSAPPERQRTTPSLAPSGPQTLTGRVVVIADGDTITLLDSANTQHRIRLEGIDAPESHQAFGEQSKQSLSEMIFGKDATVTYQKTDQYGRLVGKIILEGKDINLEQIKAGMAWHYKFYEDEQTPEDRERSIINFGRKKNENDCFRDSRSRLPRTGHRHQPTAIAHA
jgi:endonuclease YncB( thermonuclease family)